MSETSPKRLSGGNPQIPKGEGDGPVQAYIAAMPGWKRGVGEGIDRLVARVVPGARKAVKWNTPFYGAPDQTPDSSALRGADPAGGADPARGWFLAFHCFERYVKVTFFRGRSLMPVPPVASRSGDTRYFHIHEGESAETEQFAGWVRQAQALPGERL